MNTTTDTSAAFLKWVVLTNQVCAQIKNVCTKYMETPDNAHKCYDIDGRNMQFVMCEICGNYDSFASSYSYANIPQIVRCKNPDHQHQLTMMEYQKQAAESMFRIDKLVTQGTDWKSLTNELFEYANLLENWTYAVTCITITQK